MASLTFHFTFSLSLHNQPAALGLRQLGLSVCRRWRSLASRYGFWGQRLWHRTCKTSRVGLAHRTCKTSPGWLPGRRLWHRTCKTSPGWLPGVKALAQNVQDQPRVASWVNFLKEIPLNEISENLNILPKKIEGGVNFPKEIPLNEIFEKLKILLKNVRGGSIFQKKSL